jgi:dolichyl-phosphate beta-glucosyltransferase
VLEYPKNRGKGGAVRAGMSIAQGERVLMVDADGATTFSDLDRVWAKLEEIVKQKQHPLVMTVGSRRQ